MTSATLFREGFDLDEVIAELEDEYPGRVRVVDVNYGRDGGVMGFFARRTVGVRYCIEEDGVMPAFAGGPGSYGQDVSDPLDDLLRAADAAEMVDSGRVPRSADRSPAGPTPEPATGNVEFARMLLEMAAEKAAQRAARTAQEAGVPTPTQALAAPPVTPASVPPAAVGWEPAAPPVVPSATFVPPALLPPSTPPADSPAPVAPTGIAPTYPAPTHVAPTAPVAAPPVDLSALLSASRTRPVGAHRADGATHAAVHNDVHTPVDDAGRATATPQIGAHATDRQPVAAHPVAAHPVAAQPVAAQPVVTQDSRASRATLPALLGELGVPGASIDDAETDRYRAVDRLVRSLPAAPEPDLAPGRVLVVAGPATLALQAAHRLCDAHRLDPEATVHAAGCGERVAPARRVAQPWDADRLAARVRHERSAPTVVVIATDDVAGGGLDDTGAIWAERVTRALSPDAVWLAVDATRKVADVRSDARCLGRVDALAVFGAARTTSPASVWELEAPVALLDGRRATPGAWTALLLDKLADLAE